jgi:hypothetical protein
MINALHDSVLQGNCSHQIRRRTATPKATFSAFLFHFPRFHHFTANVTRALPLEVIKGEAGAMSKGIEREEMVKQQQLEPILIKTTTTTTQDTWDLLPLLKACNPYYEHPGARQHDPQRNPLDVGLFMPETSIYLCVCFAHHQGLDAQIQIH